MQNRIEKSAFERVSGVRWISESLVRTDSDGGSDVKVGSLSIHMLNEGQVRRDGACGTGRRRTRHCYFWYRAGSEGVVGRSSGTSSASRSTRRGGGRGYR